MRPRPLPKGSLPSVSARHASPANAGTGMGNVVPDAEQFSMATQKGCGEGRGQERGRERQNGDFEDL